MAGYKKETDDNGQPLLIDRHDRPVDEIVWNLFAHTVRLIGPLPTLIEWDANVPSWPVLKAEAERAEAAMFASGFGEMRHAAAC